MLVAVVFFCITFTVLQVQCRDVPQEFLEKKTFDCADEIKFDKAKFSTIFDDKFNIASEDPEVYHLLECVFKKGKTVIDDKFVRDAYIDGIAEKMIPFFRPNESNPKQLATECYDSCYPKLNSLDSLAVRIKDMHNCICNKLIP